MAQEKTLWDALFEMRDRQREEFAKGQVVIKGKDLKWEINKQGKMKWFVHPSLKDLGNNEFIYYEQEIPPGSRSGKIKHNGNKVMFILEGKGHTVINGKRYDWEKYDYVGLPIKSAGIEVQHFNDDREKPARFIVSEPNLYEIVGVDLGAGFEQLEDAPE